MAARLQYGGDDPFGLNGAAPPLDGSDPSLAPFQPATAQASTAADEFAVNPGGSATIPPTAMPFSPAQIAQPQRMTDPSAADVTMPPPVTTPAPTPTPTATTNTPFDPTGAGPIPIGESHVDPLTGLRVSGAPAATTTAPDLNTAPGWMSLVGDDAQLSAWITQNLPPGSDAAQLVPYYMKQIREKPGITPQEQAGGAAYWAGRITSGGANGGDAGGGDTGFVSTSNPNPTFDQAAGTDIANDPLTKMINDALGKFLGSSGATPLGDTASTALQKIILNGGALPDDRLTARLSQARTMENTAFQSQLADARNALANNGTLDEAGTPQGPLSTAVQRISENVAPTYASAVSGIYTDESQQADARLTSALTTATGLSQSEASNLLSAIGTGTNRQTALAQIALASLANNQNWNEFLATYGLNRDQVLHQIQTGDLASLTTLLDLFERTGATAAGGTI